MSIIETNRRRIILVRSKFYKFVNENIVKFLLWPAIIILFMIFIYPAGHMIWNSFFETISGEYYFVGVDQYIDIFTSEQFWQYTLNSLVYSFGSLFFSLGWGLICAVGITKLKDGWMKGGYTTILMMSWAMPLAVVALIWKWILTADIGFLNLLLTDLGLLSGSYPWLADTDIALPIVTLVDGWARMPFAMIVLLAGLQSIPNHMYDAAKVDGATALQRFRSVTLPYLRPYIAISALINWMFAFRAFAVIYPMTQGGPGVSTTTLSVYIYRQGMVSFNYGYASAISTVLVVITLIVATYYVTKILQGIAGDYA